MLYFLSIFCPPLAVLFTGRLGSTILNLILTCLGWIPGVIHAIFVVADAKADKRNNRLIKEMRKSWHRKL